jgi:AbrB family looped-hinge helix DNA binding protein
MHVDKHDDGVWHAWYSHGIVMPSGTIDIAGRIVVPERLRQSLGLHGGAEVDIEEHGGVIQIRPAGGHARPRTPRWSSRRLRARERRSPTT